jgi:uncharacterized protein YecE (DUF72 family)
VRFHVGTSGWQYADWRGAFYPQHLPATRWLEHYASHFPTVEVNNTFYRLPERATFEGWRDRVPERFRFAVKCSRYLTHIRRLRDPAEPVERFSERAEGLGSRLGPVLLQLPPNLTVDTERLDAALALFPRSFQLVVEPRHASWFTEEVRAALRERGAALAVTDRRGRSAEPAWSTARFHYVRLHEGRGRFGNYGEQRLRYWADRLRELRGSETWVYFNNDSHANAVRNAQTLAVMLRTVGGRG